MSAARPETHRIRTVEEMWNKVLAIARNEVENENDDNQTAETNSSHQHDRFMTPVYEHERRMAEALDTIYTASSGNGYLSFIVAILNQLNPADPVAMVFLSHLVDRSALHGRDMMARISPVIMQKIYGGRLWTLGRCHSRRRLSSRRRAADPRIKLNAVVLWSLLAEKFAGDISQAMWSDDVATLLIQLLADSHEETATRIHALLALENFAMTGPIRLEIQKHPFDIQRILRSVLHDCEMADYRLSDFLWSPSGASTEKKQGPLRRKISGGLWKRLRRSMTEAWMERWHSLRLLGRRKTIYRPSEDGIKGRSMFVTKYASLSVFDTGVLPPEDVRQEWAKYLQLAHCARWALERVFGNDDKESITTWDLSYLNVVLNPFDATFHWKIGGNGLEIRNDRPHFESIRASVGVRAGKWYYETLLLSDGVMQIGWATKQCQFEPEEGYGVGDDENGFGFDTYRAAIWANGTAIYPQGMPSVRCIAGDVLGSFIDLDRGFCSFFINGIDLGLTVAFPNYGKQIQNAHQAGMLPEHKEIEKEEEEGSFFPGINRFSSSATLVQMMEKCLDLYPAISLTRHQHVMVNFGDRPWLYPPPLSVRYRGISKAGHLSDCFKQRLTHFVRARRTLASYVDNSELDWDGPFCTICFSEPKNTALIPCGHGGWGRRCAEALDSW
ncbi:RING finger and SPRY domain-containing protein 1 [Apophysomyces ossiformis]|uniref:RING finger and SPRY domain-containing protein 1 n=1 Tax=Apophysomyces ossiformis TaxID=679940 RepID=A0A8H7EVG8_9FUNG|nr:RING finger and SPRY domain-containing protein 1 [Apophysomyces ossiformis]